MTGSKGEVTALLNRIKDGDREAAAELVPRVIGELRRLARHYMRNERVGHTLQPTALVNEAYLRLADYRQMDWKSRSHFFGVAAAVMRQVLIDYARRHRAGKRGGRLQSIPLEEAGELLSPEQSREVLQVHEALERLTTLNARHAKVVELRYFGGLSVEETAEVLGVAAITVKRDWALARAWLRTQLGTGS